MWCCLLCTKMVFLDFVYMGEIMKFGQSGSITGESVDEILECDPFLWYCLFYAVPGILTLESMEEILKCGHSNERYCPRVRRYC